MTMSLFKPQRRKPTRVQVQKGKDPQLELLRQWPQGCAVRLVGEHPHAGASGRVRHPRNKDGSLRRDFPGMLLVDLDVYSGPFRNVYAKPHHLEAV